MVTPARIRVASRRRVRAEPGPATLICVLEGERYYFVHLAFDALALQLPSWRQCPAYVHGTCRDGPLAVER